MGRELVFANGYARPYLSDPAEIDAATKFQWFPSSVDFKSTSDASGGGSGVSSVADIVKFLSAKTAGSVDELGIIGHASVSVFGLGGNIVAPTPAGGDGDVTFDPAKAINFATMATNSSAIEGIKDRFASKGRIVLYGCHAGLGDSLLNDIAKRFGVCVYGFSDAITTGFLTSGPRIIERGRVFVDSAGLLASGLGPPVGQWSKDVHSLKPDKKSPGCGDYN